LRIDHSNLASPKAVISLLGSLGVKPNKTLGQNFLIDGNTLNLIADAAQLTPESKVLEVGPGLGSLTERLLPRCASLIAIEKDPVLAGYLEQKYTAGKDGRAPPAIIRGDALECGIQLFASGKADTLVSNLPYSVGTRIVVEAALCEVPPRSMTLLLQKEVAERFVAAPRTSDYGALGVCLQTLYEIRIVHKVPPPCFFPPPEVWSAVVTLRLKQNIPAHAAFMRIHALSKIAFQNRRKQMASSMRNAPDGFSRDAAHIRAALGKCGAIPTARPEEINVAQWATLAGIW